MTNTDLKMIGIEEDTKKALDKRKIHPRETYDDVLKRLLKMNKKRMVQK